MFPLRQFVFAQILAIFTHLLVVPDYLIHAKAVLFPFSLVFGSLYHKDLFSGNFTYKGGFTCASFGDCLGAVYNGWTAHGDDGVNNICLQPITEGAVWQYTPMTWLFGVCITFIALEIGALLFCLGLLRFPAQAELCMNTGARLICILSWTMGLVTPLASLVLLASSVDVTTAQVALAITIRVGLCGTSILLSGEATAW